MLQQFVSGRDPTSTIGLVLWMVEIHQMVGSHGSHLGLMGTPSSIQNSSLSLDILVDGCDGLGHGGWIDDCDRELGIGRR